MARQGRILISALVLLLAICVQEVKTECYGNLCFQGEAPCWTNQSQMSSEVMQHHFYLYSREIAVDNQCTDSPSVELIWDDPSSLDVFDSSLAKTVVIIHGWNSDYQDDDIIGLCDAFLQMDDMNVIMVDWKEAARGGSFTEGNLGYTNSCRDGRQVALLLGKLLEELGVTTNANKFSIVGHSLGAHVAGFAGEYLQKKIGRITGLDPARPFFKNYLNPDKANCHLDSTDAQFVDVIHSDGRLHALGMPDAIGHQDFYPNRNCLYQPGCLFKPGCSHSRAIDFFVSSIKYSMGSSDACYFPTSRCSDSSSPCDPNGVDDQQCPVMGIEAHKGLLGEFCITTSCKKGFI